MNILILTEEGGLLGLADRFTREGNTVRVFSKVKNTGKGVYQVILPGELPSAVKWCKFIVSDWPQPESFYEKIAMFNKPIVGASYHTGLVNEDCVAEFAVMEKMGVNMPKSKVVVEVADIYKLLMSWEIPKYDIRYDREWFSGHHKEFMNWAVSKVPPGKAILLQEPLEGDMEAQVIGLFNGQEFIKPFFVTSWDNSIGSAVVFPLTEGEQIVVQNLNKLDQYLRMVDYHGPVRARLTLRGEEVFCRELRFGFSFPEDYAILENMQGSAASIFHALAFGISFTPQINEKISAAVEVSVDRFQGMHGAPVLNMEAPEKIRHMFPCGVMKSDLKVNEYFISGELPLIYTVTAHEDNLKELRHRLTRTIQNSEFPQMRFDLVSINRATRMMMFLKDRKYLNAA